MKKRIALSCLLLSGLLLFSCEAESPREGESSPVESESHPADQMETPSTGETDIPLTDSVKSETLDKTLPIPESWREIAIVDSPASTAGKESIILFQLYEKIAREAYETGFVWALSAQTREDFAELQAHFMETEGVDVYASVYGTANYVIGSDGDYMYILALPTDVQYLLDEPYVHELYNPDSAVNYAVLQEESQAVLSAFLEQNGISVNELCPASDCYSPAME